MSTSTYLCPPSAGAGRKWLLYSRVSGYRWGQQSGLYLFHWCGQEGGASANLGRPQANHCALWTGGQEWGGWGKTPRHQEMIWIRQKFLHTIYNDLLRWQFPTTVGTTAWVLFVIIYFFTLWQIDTIKCMLNYLQKVMVFSCQLFWSFSLIFEV